MQFRLPFASGVGLSLCLAFCLYPGCEISPWSAGKDTTPAAGKPSRSSARKTARGGSKGSKSTGGRKAGRSRPATGGSLGMRGGGAKGARRTGVPGYPAGLKNGSTSDGAPWIGGARAKVTIVEFSDYACPYCVLGARRMKNLLKIYGTKIKLVFRQMPIGSLHPDSFRASEAALAAHAQGKFWQMHDLLFANPKAHSRADLIKYARKLGLNMARFLRELDARKYKKRVQADLNLGNKKNVEGTPTFFVNDYKVGGLAPMKDFKKLIRQHLK